LDALGPYAKCYKKDNKEMTPQPFGKTTLGGERGKIVKVVKVKASDPIFFGLLSPGLFFDALPGGLGQKKNTGKQKEEEKKGSVGRFLRQITCAKKAGKERKRRKVIYGKYIWEPNPKI